ncbi:FabD/lysophospholipase-like protein [Piedraia hortae CBS 480.64]|uniref:FabD/lysophospholipase-like protein n=1 Tax=Piedraia hortae CBS 480.64 TaxID=1314780 RepID=A0A6A7C755_9PEZI|nr:FabD/lysophospholipase-like protein [Piedraia hortae CBS 480.64]
MGINLLFYGAAFSGRPLEEAIGKVLAEHSQAEDPWRDYLVHPNSGMMFVCATLQDKGESMLLRSYAQPKDACPITDAAKAASESGAVSRIDIISAARATSAAPIYLPAETWQGIRFWDGGVLNNNPVDQLWNARYDLVAQGEPPPLVECMVSLGCGLSDMPQKKWWWWLRVAEVASRYVQTFLVNSIARHRDFARLVQRMRHRGDSYVNVRYFRLDCPTGPKFLDISDPSIMSDLEERTRDYVKGEAWDDIEAISQMLAKP